MTSLYIFTAGNPTARDHLSKSIKNPISAEALEAASTEASRRLTRRLLADLGELYAWGAEPGIRNEPNWESMELGDYVLTVYDGTYHFVSQVVGKLNDESLAQAIWGRDDESGETWQYMYFLSKPRAVDVPLEDVLPYLHKGYQGFTRISDDRLATIRSAYGSLGAFLSNTFESGRDRAHSLGTPAGWRAAVTHVELQREFNPDNEADARMRTMQAIVRRQGQPEFRKKLLAAYGGRCAVTGCDVPEALEAAHIIPYRGDHTNHPQNGLLLRSDIHTLFDYGLVCIDPDTMTVAVAPQLEASAYQFLSNKPLAVPTDPDLRPSRDAIDWHRSHCAWRT